MAPTVLDPNLTSPRVDSLEIQDGTLGPVGPCRLRVHPLTVFIGPQGTGKSLVAQVLYALEELPFLTQYVQSQAREKLTAEALFARLVDQLRSTERRFAGFAGGTTTIRWKRGEEWEVAGQDQFSFTMYQATSRTRPTTKSQQVVEALASPGLRTKRHAVFVPTERMVVSQLRSALAERVLSLPITYELFADWLDIASAAQVDLNNPQAQLIAKLSNEALGGHAKRTGEHWKWRFHKRGGGTRALDLDMASSGQRANWSIGYLAQALFSLRKERGFARVLTLFVEEPELHLHPEAQIRMIQVLAVLVNSGFRVVVTTHSLGIIYCLNNLLLARKRFALAAGRDLPDPSMRLRSEDVAVYEFSRGQPEDIIDRQEAFIDERALAEVSARLGAEMNRMLNRESPR